MGWGTGILLPATVSLASALGWLGYRWARHRRGPVSPARATPPHVTPPHLTPPHLTPPQAAAVPALWESAGDFAEGGWCRTEFDTLRLL